MRVRSELIIDCRDASTARTLLRVLAPDNRAFPKNQKFVSLQKGRRLLFQVESTRISSLISTVESLLSDAGLFQDILMVSHD